jgi:uncharacterized membrane protein YbhN (UPF0104 family)
MRHRTARALAGVVLGAVLAWLLARGSGGVEEVTRSVVVSLSQADPGLLAAALGLFLGSQVLRAFRWRLLSLRTDLPMARSLPLTSVHIGLGHLLPVRLSDVAMVGLFRHHASLPLGDGTGVVIVSKLLDLVAMGSVVAVVVAMGAGGAAAVAAPAVAAAGVVGVLLLPGLLRLVRRPVGAAALRIAGGHKLLRWFRELRCASSFRRSRGRLAGGLALSLLVWVMKMMMFLMLLRAVSPGLGGLPLWKLFTAFAVTDLTLALPVHGLMGIGTVEAGWTAGFAMAGIRGAEVVRAGFTVHIIWLAMAMGIMVLASPVVIARGTGRRGGERP